VNTPLDILSSLPRPKLLVVDDQPNHIHLINELFRDEYDVLMAKNGKQALRICERQQPDLVLLDVIMDDLDGYEVCRRLKVNPATADIPVVFLTSNADDMNEVFGFAVGAVDYIKKPIQPAVVCARVKAQLALKRQNDIMRLLAQIDGLTGIPNRRQFDRQLDVQWRHCQRQQTPLSLILLDVDQFKRYNDHYGHLAGDRCLQIVARTLQQAVNRPLDLVARYGGEEFALILPGTDGDGAMQVAEKLVKAVAAQEIEHHATDAAGKVTVSAGAASIIPNRGITPQELLNAADEQLYLAKKAGRGRAFLMGTSCPPGNIVSSR
jgi:diguanylate cyclase (GGDEF)-like protein